MLTKSLLAVVASATAVAAQSKGFNYASAGQTQDSFESSIKTGNSLPGAAKGFNSARLYTMIQDGTPNTPISAIPAAIASKGTLLLGLWASAGQTAFDNEITALKSAIKQYGQQLADVTVGISVGSEDLYRITDTSTIINKDPNPGAQPSTIVSYIKQVRDAIKGTPLDSAPVGHVDTYTSFINGSNQAVIDNCDFLGMDAYPYYQTTVKNSIEDAHDLFFSALSQTQSAAGGKPVWVTETGWPTSGKTYNLATASVENAEKYWKAVACELIGKTNLWWFDLSETGANPDFGLIGADGKPKFNLTCDASSSSSSSSSGNKTSGSETGASATNGAKATDSASAGGSGSEGSGSGSGSSATGSASASGTGAPPFPLPSGMSSVTSAAGTGVTTPSTPRPTASTFTGAANHHAEVGVTAAAVLGFLGYFL